MGGHTLCLPPQGWLRSSGPLVLSQGTTPRDTGPHSAGSAPPGFSGGGRAFQSCPPLVLLVCMSPALAVTYPPRVGHCPLIPGFRAASLVWEAGSRRWKGHPFSSQGPREDFLYVDSLWVSVANVIVNVVLFSFFLHGSADPWTESAGKRARSRGTCTPGWAGRGQPLRGVVLTVLSLQGRAGFAGFPVSILGGLGGGAWGLPTLG